MCNVHASLSCSYTLFLEHLFKCWVTGGENTGGMFGLVVKKMSNVVTRSVQLKFVRTLGGRYGKAVAIHPIGLLIYFFTSWTSG